MNYELLIYLAVKTGNPHFIYNAWFSIVQTKDDSTIVPIYKQYRNLIKQCIEQHTTLEDPKDIDPEQLLFTILDSLEEK